jgi:DNA-directed RNA polymerase specialized sigma24 family protein
MTVDTALIVRLRDQYGLTFGQIAEQVGMSIPGATSRYRRAKQVD